MASIRRTLSPVPRPGALVNREACQVASPLSESSSNSQNYPQHCGLLPTSLGSLDYPLCKSQNFILGLFSQRSSRPLDRSKLKGLIWPKAFFHFLMCFVVGVFVGLTPFVPLSMSTHVMPTYQAFEALLPENNELYHLQKNEPLVDRVSFNESSTSVRHEGNLELNDGSVDRAVSNNSVDMASDLVIDKLLIIVTPTHTRPLQAYYLNRMAHTLKLVPHPLLWVVVEMNSQSVETAEILRNIGVVYRHLVCSTKNATEITDRNVLLRNVALSHIETHRLDGIVCFADDDKIYSVDLFDQMRKISRIGTWMVAKLVGSNGKIVFEGPICNGSRVIGWHLVNMSKRFRRFHAETSGFAFNSTIIWDPKRWHRPTIEPIRQLETVTQDLQASTFMEQLVEDESQMECFSMDTSEILVWHHAMDSHPYPHSWFTTHSLALPLHLSEI